MDAKDDEVHEQVDTQQSEAGEEAAPAPDGETDHADHTDGDVSRTDKQQQSEAASEAQPEPPPQAESATQVETSEERAEEQRQESEAASEARHGEVKWEHDEHPLTMLDRLNSELKAMKLSLRGITH